jgi:hypothetical protein
MILGGYIVGVEHILAHHSQGFFKIKIPQVGVLARIPSIN